ncbi:MAG TPA: peptidylprolyl isomerase [Burkholderiales bacterium]|nr:peptidylprolyl isomerase [Burkholderiales bacterium]
MSKLLQFLILMLPIALAAQGVTPVDRIVAVVNKEVITATELADAVGAAQRQLRRQGTPLPDRALLERQMLERLILDKAQMQLARDKGIRVDELQLDRAVQRVAQNNNMSLADFRRALERDNVPFQAWREELREQILMNRLREREVDDRVQVSDTEIDLFLAEAQAKPDSRVEYQISHILVRVPEQASPERIEQARARAQKALAEARAGADFASLAASYSDAPDALQGGVLGWRSHDRLPELFSAALGGMMPGTVTEVLRSPAGFHLLRLTDRRGAALDGAPVAQTRLRHILIRASESMSESEALRRLNDLRARIVSGAADFAEMARVHSGDATAARGGELDWVYPGDTVPDFERAYQELKIGEISQPVRTPFGYHLIQVLERRSAEQSPERRRLQARQALRERKADQAYQDWLRQLRDQVYVELRLEER